MIDVFGDTYLTFRYDLDPDEAEFRSIAAWASLAHWEDLNLWPEWIDLGGES